MKAVVVHKIGDVTTNECLTVPDDVPVPEPKKGQILVKVHAAAINPVDWKLAEGMLPMGYKGGPLGSDLAGVVEKIGPDTTTDLKVGDEVYGDAIDTKGAFGEFCVANEHVLAKKPTNISMVEAASLPLVGLTALQGLTTKGDLKEGQKVLIFGGTSGVGSLAIQMAKSLGASEVYATGSSVSTMKDLGADVVVNYKEQDLMAELKGKDFDLIYDTIGSKKHWEVAQASLKKKRGIYVTIVGDNSGSMFKDMSTFMFRKMKGKIFGGPQYRLFLTSTSAPEVVKDMKKITEMVEKDDVKPFLDNQKFELTTEGVHDLIKASKSHRAKGKLVLKIV